MTKLYQIDPNWQNDTEHLSLLKMLKPFIKRDDFEPFLGPQRGGVHKAHQAHKTHFGTCEDGLWPAYLSCR